MVGGVLDPRTSRAFLVRGVASLSAAPGHGRPRARPGGRRARAWMGRRPVGRGPGRRPGLLPAAHPQGQTRGRGVDDPIALTP